MYREAVVKDNKVFCPVCGALNMTLTGEEQMRNVRIRCRKSKSNSEHYFIVNVGGAKMKSFVINDKEYKLEYSFEASICNEFLESMFKVITGAYMVVPGVKDKAEATIQGTASMVADIPRICKIAFYAGLLENNPVSEEEAYELMKQYMIENEISFSKLFEDMKECMEQDNFWKLSGLEDIIVKLSENGKKGKKKNA